MDIDQKLPLLGGLSPAQFMRRHWHRKPLLVRQAVPAFEPLLSRSELFALAAQPEVESRFVRRDNAGVWQLRKGPFGSRALPSARRPGWTLLVQGVDQHDARAHALLQQFSFVPAVRLDDLMVSWASDGGGVGPHFDSYDVFLLQAQGKRRWRIGRQADLALEPGAPLKILRDFRPETEYVLEPGDMLYLPPGYAHDGVAVGECQTCSIGFRAPARAELAREVLSRIADEAGDGDGRLYRDPAQPATPTPGAIPAGLQAFAREAVRAALADASALARALGESLTEPKANVWFDAVRAPRQWKSLSLDPRTRMLYDEQHVYVNGESWRASGRDALLMRRLADQRTLAANETARASEAARALLQSWCEAGWAHPTRRTR